MKLFCPLYLVCLLLCCSITLPAQTGQSFIIQLEEKAEIDQVIEYFKEKNITIQTRLIAKSIGAYLLTHSVLPTRKSSDWSRFLERCPFITDYQPNRTYERRRITPNDPKFNEQWYLDMIKMPEAWELTTGMISPGAYQPVIGVLEAGYDFAREDLQGILFENPGEIPGNNIDDDNNGYVDDVNGWNFDSEDGNHYIDYTYHGDAVVSIMAALGNNKTGIAGINWDAKILPLTLEARNTDAATIEAYEYFYQMRKKFNETDGAQGAFVVVTNSSFGLDGLFEEDAPVFCSMYDKMGSVGILSVGATSNQDVNVDIHGDLPSDCSSPDLIIVNSIDRDKLNNYSGRGTKSVDLAAPAQKILVVSKPGEFIEDSGTSFAAPQVSGVISLAYTLSLDSLQRAIKQSPVEVAESIRTCLLENTTPAPDLADENATGGYLNAHSALQCVHNKYYVPETSNSLSITKIYPNATTEDLNVEYAVKDAQKTIKVVVYDILGKKVKEDTIDPTTDNPMFIRVSDLPAGVYALSFIQDKNVATEQFIKL